MGYEFKVGDRVEVVGGSRFIGKKATVIDDVHRSSLVLLIDGDNEYPNGYYVHFSYIKLISHPTPTKKRLTLSMEV